MLDSPCFQASDCTSPNHISSSGVCMVSDGDEDIHMTSTEFLCNHNSPDSDLAAVSTLSTTVPPGPRNEYDDDDALKSSVISSSASMPQHVIPGDFDAHLDHIVLTERRQMLLSRLLLKSPNPCIEAYSVEMPKSYLCSRDAVHQSFLTISEESNGEQLNAKNLHTGKIDHDLFCASNTSKSEIINKSSAPSSDNLNGAESVEVEFSTSCDDQENLKSKALPSSIQVKVEPFLSDEFGDGGKCVMENFTGSVVPVEKELGVKLSPARKCSFSGSRDLKNHNKTVSSTVKLGIGGSETAKLSISESNDSGTSCWMEKKLSDEQEKVTNSHKAVSSYPSAICVKMETVLSSEIDNEGKTDREKSLSPSMLPVKTEAIFSSEAFEDELDHMSLFDRLKLLSRETSPSPEHSKNLRYPSRNSSSILGLDRDVSDSVESISVTHPRKRRRTATNSAETALEEDVPGLLKVLIDKGVLVEEIKLYGEPESDEAIDEAFCEDSIADLEDVIHKVFSHRESLLKATPLCCSKGSKVTYCLGCLISLVEQACYLRIHKWPVEWGWCRDLQAFIFVFQRHNRIVLERPEYGYATYFFELLDSLPVDWQIRRLVTTMKLTNCSRISLLENRPLKVGEDLSEGEARVLCQYGWVPNTGLATMLNYCGRVVHDTNKERDGNEWRLKIARMLVNGYNGGSVVPNFLPEKTMETESTPSAQVKLEI